MPLVAFVLLIRRGAADDPPGKDGLAALTADMLDEGSGDLSAIQIHEALARLGVQIETDIGSDATLVGLTVLSRFTERALEQYSLETLFVVYCGGPHCNGADRAAIRLATQGWPVKKMIGGITGWIDEGFPFAEEA